MGCPRFDGISSSSAARLNAIPFQSNYSQGLPADSFKPGSPIFRIKLPLSAEDCNQKKCILVADDNENDRKMIKDILSDTDFEILEAATIDEALAAINAAQSSALFWMSIFVNPETAFGC